MEHQVRGQYTADCKAQAVSLAETLGATKAVRKLGISVKTLANWIRISCDGAGFVRDCKRRPVSDLEAENARLRTENTQLRMERDFLKKPLRTSRRSPSEVRLHRLTADSLSARVHVPGARSIEFRIFRLAGPREGAPERWGRAAAAGGRTDPPEQPATLRPPPPHPRAARSGLVRDPKSRPASDARGRPARLAYRALRAAHDR